MLRLYLLGPFEVWRDGERIPLSAWRTQQTLSLLKVLLDERGFVQRVVSDGLSPGRRRNWHRRTAAALEQLHAGHPAPLRSWCSGTCSLTVRRRRQSSVLASEPVTMP